jgi:hypothetical protein
VFDEIADRRCFVAASPEAIDGGVDRLAFVKGFEAGHIAGKHFF